MASLGQAAMHGASSQCMQLIGRNRASPLKEKIWMRDLAGLLTPNRLREQAIWHCPQPLHFDGFVTSTLLNMNFPCFNPIISSTAIALGLLDP
jgi:hypothetical protein